MKLTKDEIINKSIEYILQSGINNVSIFSIAKQLNVSRRTIYRYFETKEHLLFEIYQKVYLELLNNVIEKRGTLPTKCSREKCFENANIVIENYLNNREKANYIVEFDAYKLSSKELKEKQTKLMFESDYMLSVLKEAEKEGLVNEKKDVVEFTWQFMDTVLGLVHRYTSVNNETYTFEVCKDAVYYVAYTLLNDFLNKD